MTLSSELESVVEETVIDPAIDQSSPPVAGSADLPLSKNRDFRIVIGGQSISALGDAITLTALPLLVLSLTGSGVAMGTVGALQSLPDLLLGLPAGAISDRWDRRRLMLWSDFGRAVLTALIPIAFFLHLDTMAVILLVTFPINAFRVLFLAGWTASMPSLVGRSQVGRAIGYSEAILSLSYVVGPAIAGILAKAIGPAPTLAIDALSFLLSAGSLFLVQRPLQQARDGTRKEQHIVTEMLEGLRFIVREPTLRAVLAFWSLSTLLTASLVNAVIFVLQVDEKLGADLLGLVLSGYGIGYTIGAVVAGRVARGRLGLFMLFGTISMAVFVPAFALFHDPLIHAVSATGAGVSGALVLISYVTLRATIPPDYLLGRVGSTARMLSLGITPVGLLAGGILLDRIGGGNTMLLISAGLLTLVALFALVPTVRDAVAGTGRH